MKMNPPVEIADYQYDEKGESRSALLPRVLGWLSFLFLVAAVGSFFFFQEVRQMRMISIVGFIVLFVSYFIFKVKKRSQWCNQCRQDMEIIDVKWTPEQWKQVQGYELLGSFKGADGNLYTIEKQKRGGSTTYFIHSHIQSWTVCHQCRTYFLNAKYMREMLFSTIDKEEFEQAKQLLLSDPKASENMELAYKEGLKG